jgi:hypothetical protein
VILRRTSDTGAQSSARRFVSDGVASWPRGTDGSARRTRQAPQPPPAATAGPSRAALPLRPRQPPDVCRSASAPWRCTRSRSITDAAHAGCGRLPRARRIGLAAMPFGFEGLWWQLMAIGIDWMIAVTRWIANLPGPVGRVTAFGTGPLIAARLGVILLGLLRTPLRWSAGFCSRWRSCGRRRRRSRIFWAMGATSRCGAKTGCCFFHRISPASR